MSTTAAGGRAVLVGVDEFDAGWRLDGPVRDARALADLLLHTGMPPDHITLLLSPAGDRDYRGIRVRPADHGTVRKVLVAELSASPSEFLLIGWGGHGVVDGGDRRLLFCADATTADKRNIELNSLLTALRTSRYRHPRQAVLIDACQTYAEDLRFAHAPTTEEFPRGVPVAGVTQQVLMAASPGQLAGNDDRRGTGLFSAVVRDELGDAWPPDFDVLRDRVRARFAGLRASGQTRQVPSYLWSRGTDGEELLFTATRNRAGKLGARALGELVDLMLDVDELADQSVRWQTMLDLLPREIIGALSSTGAQRVQLINLVRACERFPHGPSALLDAIRTAVADDAARARLEAAFRAAWPGC